jgi:multiple sugar transport system permease protein
MLFPKVGRTQPKMRITWWSVVILLWVGILLHLFPFYFMISTSFKTAYEAMAMPPTLWPQEPTTAAWRLIFDVSVGGAQGVLNQPLGVYFRNSLIMTFGTLLLSLPITSFAAYANSKLIKGRASRWIFLFFIGTLMLPAAVTLIPSFLLTRNFPFPLPSPPLIPGTDTLFPTIRIWDTYWAVIIPFVFNAFNFLLFKGFFDTIPDSVIQAARVDGGSELNIFRRIVMPMCVPVYAVAAYFQFAGTWDSYLWPLVVLQSTDVIPVTVAIRNVMDRFAQAGVTSPEAAVGASIAMRQLLDAGLSWNGLMVLALLQAFPVFVFFIICREYLLKGVRIRGLK